MGWLHEVLNPCFSQKEQETMQQTKAKGLQGSRFSASEAPGLLVSQQRAGFRLE